MSKCSCCNEHEHHEHQHEHEHHHEHCSCGCGHDCGDNDSKFLLPRLLAALALLAASILTDFIPLYFAAYIIAGYDVIFAAVKGLIHGKIFNESFLMSIATIGAFIIGDYAEGVAVMVFYGLGEFIQDKAVDKSSDSINELIRLRPDHACIVKDGRKFQVPPSEVKIGDIIAVAPGERVPLDGVLISDSATADTSALTGESLPRDYKKGEELLSGIINTKSEITLSVTQTLENSSTERIFKMVTEARENKSKSERFISRFAAIYTPAVVIAALLLAFVPPIFVGNLTSWVHRGLIFLVASCPCALVLSVPLTYFAGMGLASKNGILFKGSVYMEQLAGLDTAAFDKTGTLTKGRLEIFDISANGVSKDELIKIAACAERYSEHPIGKAIAKMYTEEADISEFTELTGGVSAVVNGDKITAGNTALTGIESQSPNTAVHVLKNGEHIGSLYLADTIRPDSKAAIAKLETLGIGTAMITGDSSAAAMAAAKAIGIDEVYSEVLPTEKLNIVKGLKGITAFVGDGINDSPALSGANIGIAMGGMGREAAMEAADVVIMDDSPAKVPLAVLIARKVLNTAVFNITFALLIKAAVLILGAMGIANMWLAVFADVGVAVIAVAVAVLRCRKL